MVGVDRECIGTVGCMSKSHALRCAVKQSCEVGAVPHTGNLCQRADGHLTSLRGVTYPARGHATREFPPAVASSSNQETNNKQERSDVIGLFNNFELAKIRLENVTTYKLAQKRKCRNRHFAKFYKLVCEADTKPLNYSLLLITSKNPLSRT